MKGSSVHLLALSAVLNAALLLVGLVLSSPPLPQDGQAKKPTSRRLQEREVLSPATLDLTTILDPTTKELSPNIKYTDIVHGLTDEYMAGTEEEISWDLLKRGLRAMQSDEKLGRRPSPFGRLANTTYDELRSAITSKYFASYKSTSRTKQFMSALEVMYKMENADHAGKPLPIETQPYLFVGSAGPAYNLKALKETGITHIISVTSGVRPQFPDDFEYLHIQGLFDDAKDPQNSLAAHFNETIPFIDMARKNGGRCYVHCWEGRSRSVTVVASYLIQSEGMNREAALRLIRRTRPMARPNDRFMRELEELSLNLHTKIADDFDDRLDANIRILKDEGSLEDNVQSGLAKSWTYSNKLS